MHHPMIKSLVIAMESNPWHQPPMSQLLLHIFCYVDDNQTLNEKIDEGPHKDGDLW